MEQKLPEVVVKNVRVLSLGVLNTNFCSQSYRYKVKKNCLIGLSVKKIEWK